MMLPVILENPRVTAWLIAWRSTAWFAARRTRRSCHGELGSHWSEDEALHARRLAPVALEGFQHELDPRRERDELVGTGPDRRLPEPVLAHSLDILPGDDPGRARCRCAVERHEVRPRLLEPETDAPGIRRLDRGDLLLERPRGDAAVPVERELDVLGRDGLAVVERRSLAQ